MQQKDGQLKDITDQIPMIVINCYIAIAFVKYFSYKNK